MRLFVFMKRVALFLDFFVEFPGKVRALINAQPSCSTVLLRCGANAAVGGRVPTEVVKKMKWCIYSKRSVCNKSVVQNEI